MAVVVMHDPLADSMSLNPNAGELHPGPLPLLGVGQGRPPFLKGIRSVPRLPPSFSPTSRPLKKWSDHPVHLETYHNGSRSSFSNPRRRSLEPPAERIASAWAARTSESTDTHLNF